MRQSNIEKETNRSFSLFIWTSCVHMNEGSSKKYSTAVWSNCDDDGDDDGGSSSRGIRTQNSRMEEEKHWIKTPSILIRMECRRWAREKEGICLNATYIGTNKTHFCPVCSDTDAATSFHTRTHTQRERESTHTNEWNGRIALRHTRIHSQAYNTVEDDGTNKTYRRTTTSFDHRPNAPLTFRCFGFVLTWATDRDAERERESLATRTHNLIGKRPTIRCHLHSHLTVLERGMYNMVDGFLTLFMHIRSCVRVFVWVCLALQRRKHNQYVNRIHERTLLHASSRVSFSCYVYE